LITAVVAVGFVSSAQAAGVNLAPRFEAGTVAYYVSESIIRHDVSADLLDSDETVTLKSDTGMSLRVAAVDSNGVAEVIWTQHYVAVTGNGTIPGIPSAVDYDSRLPASATSPLGFAFTHWVGKPITLRVDRDGNVLSFGGLPDIPANDPYAQLAKSFFSRAAFEQLPFLITVGAPNPANVRDTWTRKHQIDLPMGGMGLIIRREFRLDRLRPRRRSARLSMQGSITGAALAQGRVGGMPMPAGVPLAVESGAVAGRFEWDYANGRLLTGESRLDLVTHIETRVGKMTLGQHLTGSITHISAEKFERRARSRLTAPKRGSR
jgi:hypothetical protein